MCNQVLQEQIVETVKVVSQERVTQRTSEQFEVHTRSTSTSEQTVDIPIPRCVEKVGDMSVQLSTHAINECMHSIKNQQRESGQTRGGDLEPSLEVAGVDQVAWVPTRCTTSRK